MLGMFSMAIAADEVKADSTGIACNITGIDNIQVCDISSCNHDEETSSRVFQENNNCEQDSDIVRFLYEGAQIAARDRTDKFIGSII